MLDHDQLIARASAVLDAMTTLDANGDRDYAAIVAPLSDNFAFEAPFMPEPFRTAGRDSFENVQRSTRGAFTAIERTVIRSIADVEKQIAVIEQSSMATTCKGKPVKLDYCNVFAFEGDKIASLTEYVYTRDDAALGEAFAAIGLG